MCPAVFDSKEPLPEAPTTTRGSASWSARRCRTHGIRHRAATDIANSGVPIKVGMALTAHKTVTQFMTYVHTEDDPVRAAAERSPTCGETPSTAGYRPRLPRRHPPSRKAKNPPSGAITDPIATAKARSVPCRRAQSSYASGDRHQTWPRIVVSLTRQFGAASIPERI